MHTITRQARLRRVGRVLPLLFAFTALVACDRNHSQRTTSFNGFVENLFEQTDETSSPVPVNGRRFTFTSNENAFDRLLNDP